MPKFIIRWNTGYGDNHEVIEADNEEAARGKAYEQWREDSENGADYGTLEYNQDNCEDFDLEWEADDGQS